MHPLSGVTVVALEHAVAAPLASRHLADLGARVIKIERPGDGDFARHYDRAVLGEASYFVWLNRGKESVELDLKTEADISLLRSVIATADVVIQNLLPGAVDRLGIGPDELLSQRSDLIYCSISGYGDSGPYATRKAYDLLVQCESGLVAVTGTPKDPAKVGISVVDIATGMYALTGILTALYERERNGRGGLVRVSMFDAIGEWMMQPTYMSVYGQRNFDRSGAEHASIAPYGPHETCDGAVFLGVQSNREWAILCEQVLGMPELVDDARFRDNTERVTHRSQIRAILESAWATKTCDQVSAELDANSIACARLRTPLEFAAHPQLAARDRWRDVESPGGTVRALLPPFDFAGREPCMGEVPRLGAHTAAVREEFQTPPRGLVHD